jgi:hypothetical protein
MARAEFGRRAIEKGIHHQPEAAHLEVTLAFDKDALGRPSHPRIAIVSVGHASTALSQVQTALTCNLRKLRRNPSSFLSRALEKPVRSCTAMQMNGIDLSRCRQTERRRRSGNSAF